MEDDLLKLYSYYRSSASYRVRLALHLKQIEFEYNPIHLLNNGGEQNQADYQKLNPFATVPTLVDGDFALGESMAIFNYLERLKPTPALFPTDAKSCARVIQICEVMNAGAQPLQNLRVTQHLQNECKFSPAQVSAWIQHWASKAFRAVEALLESSAGQFCVGDRVTAADCFLVPQCFSARRFGVEIETYPRIAKIDATARALYVFEKAHPDRQPDGHA